jgi:phage-related protein
MYFNYRGKSSRDFCLKIKEINNLSSPSRALEIHEVLGRNGELIIDQGNYTNFHLQIECFVDGRPERNGKELSLAELASELKLWLQTSFEYSPIQIEGEDFYYEGYCDNSLDIKELFTNFGQVLLSFNCKPYRKKDSEKIVMINKDQTIINEYMDSEPYIKILGNGDITLDISGRIVKFKNVENYIEIDSELFNCFKDNVNQNNRMYGEFPILKSGDNVITWSGNVQRIEIEPRWVRL